MDLVGPLKATADGNHYIVIFTEYLSRWAEAKPLPNKTAAGVASALIECVISRFGCPETIISDQGREFVNTLNEQLCRDLDIRRNLCSAYHPQSNVLTKRFNQTLIHQLRKLVNEDMDNWGALIPWVLMSYRANKQSSTRFSPFFTVYGQQMRLPVEVDGTDPEHLPLSLVDEEKIMNVRMERIKSLPSFRSACKENIMAAQEKQKQQYDAKREPPAFTVGDLVWYRNNRRDTRKGGKLESVWAGKAMIEAVLGKGTYRLTGLKRMYNAVNLKLAVSDLAHGSSATADVDPSTMGTTNPSLSTSTSTNPSLSTSTSTNPSLSTSTSTNPSLSTSTSTNPSLSTSTSTNPSRSTSTSTNPSLSSSASSSALTSPDVKVTGATTAAVSHVFTPPNVNWQRKVCQKEKLSFLAKSGPFGQVHNAQFNAFTKLTRNKQIAGDGNCFFRAAFYVITGSKDQHDAVRKLICDHIIESPLQFDGKAGDLYLRSTNMRKLGIWGTNDECQAVADWLQVSVFVFCRFGSRLSWQKHSPRTEGKSQFGIYLDNSSASHYNLVMSVGRK